MYIAELKGKIPSNFEKMEDILTSNVFSFFKYSDRTIFLKSFLNKLNIQANDRELNETEFIFWPIYEDGTEPDLVMLVGDYYLLFESKYFSDFGKKTFTLEDQLEKEALDYQLVRETVEGSKAAKEIGKHFFIIAITADYYFKPERFEFKDDVKEDVKKAFNRYFKWINWHTITELLLSLIEEQPKSLPNLLFANDLYQLLDKKKLRAFRNFDVLAGIFNSRAIENIFFLSGTAKYKGDFLGFLKAFLNFPIIKEAPQYVFFNSYIKK